MLSLQAQEEILNKKLEAEALRCGCANLDELRGTLVLDGLQQRQERRNKQDQAKRVAADTLLITSTRSEHEGFLEVARELGLDPPSQKGPSGHTYRHLTFGDRKVAEINLISMGPERAIHSCLSARAETQATSVIIIGTAYGIDPERQRLGDVLVADEVLACDERNVRDDGELHEFRVAALNLTLSAKRGDSGPGWRYEFRNAAVQSDRNLFEAMLDAGRSLRTEPRYSFMMYSGALLSGGARIESARYLRHLTSSANVGSPVVGGDMETAAIAGLAEPMGFGWLSVKGISDFAESIRASYLEDSRKVASRNAATLVLLALQRRMSAQGAIQ